MMLTELLQKNEKFSDAENEIAEFFLHCENDLTQISARAIAKELFVSPSTVTRFTQKMGFSGFSEFVRALQEEKTYLSTHFTQIDPNYPFKKTESYYQIAGKISSLYKEIIEDTVGLIDAFELDKCVELVRHADIIHVISSGSHVELGELFKDKIAKIGKRVIVTKFSDVAFSYAFQPMPNEAYILISYSGETEQILKTAEQLSRNKKSFIAITSFGQNSLSKYTENILYVSTRERLKSGVGNYGIYLSAMYLLDLLYSCIFRAQYDDNLKRRYEIAKKFQNNRKTDNPILKDIE